jgi:predicted RNA binding protein YcfA (HicA-like mRNA interferase family)
MKSSELVRRFHRAGWVEIRQTGSHKIFKDPKSGRIVPVPYHGAREIGTGLANKLLKLLK